MKPIFHLLVFCLLATQAVATEPFSRLVREGRFLPEVDLVSLVQKPLGRAATRQLTADEYRAYRTSFGVFGLRVDYPPGDPDYVICDGWLIGIRPDRYDRLPPLHALMGRKVRGVRLLARRSELEARLGDPQHEERSTYGGHPCAKLDYYSGPEGTCLSFYVAKERVLAIAISVM